MGFASSDVLKDHEKRHSGELLCGICREGFKTVKDLVTHVLTHPEKKPYCCEVCGKQFNLDEQLKEHTKLHTKELVYSCTICKQRFKYMDACKEHEKNHIKPSLYDIGMKAIKSLQELDRQKLTHAEEGRAEGGKSASVKSFVVLPSVIDKAPKMTKSEHNLTNTTGTVDSITTYVGLQSAVLERLKAAGEIKSGNANESNKDTSCLYTALNFLSTDAKYQAKGTTYSCEIRERTYDRRDLLETHDCSHTGNKPFSCEVCGNTFNNSTYLKIRKWAYAGGNPHSCDVCLKQFHEKKELEDHKHKHNRKKPFSCTICGKLFASSTECEDHQNSHAETRPSFSCGLCGKNFNTLPDLHVHRMKHLLNIIPSSSDFHRKQSDSNFPAGEAPYSCNVCKQRFHLLGVCIEHEKKHTAYQKCPERTSSRYDNAPYSCAICNMLFATLDKLKKHEKKHVEECKFQIEYEKLPYSCATCKERFSSLDDCKEHVKKHTEQLKCQNEQLIEQIDSHRKQPLCRMCRM